MNEKLRMFLEAKKEDEIKRYEFEKQKMLIELGLCYKVYSPDDKYSQEYSQIEWDSTNQVSKYFKMVPIEITDEEYQEVKKYAKKESEEKGRKNAVATALTGIAWFIFIAGFIAGIALGKEEYYGSDFSFAIALTYWGVSLITGTMFLGFAEIIKLLDAIKRK